MVVSRLLAVLILSASIFLVSDLCRPSLIWFSCDEISIVMALLNILTYPDRRLYKKAKPVTVVDDRIRQLVQDMAQTMYDAPGVGLAATQVDVHEQVVVVDVSETRDQLQVFINPEIIELSDETTFYEEGCLSVPGIYEEVKRPEKIKVKALNEAGVAFEAVAEGLLAVCLQHEIDHLRGKVFVEYLSPLKQSRIKTKMRKLAPIGVEVAQS